METDSAVGPTGYWMICGAHWTQRCECNDRCAGFYGCDCRPMQLSPANAAAFGHAACQVTGDA